MSSRTPAKIIVISNTSGGNSSKRFRAVPVLNTVFARSLSLWERVPRSGGWGQKIDPHPALRATFSQREKDPTVFFTHQTDRRSRPRIERRYSSPQKS